ncbi:MAG: 2OG-Fe(II) oxygenase, partial [Elainellaceae cyanobacterium]
LLSAPTKDFTGGEFVLTEQKSRAQARAHVLKLDQGDAVIFAGNQRPGQGPRGVHRIAMKHGISSLSSGRRYCLGIIFHDAA